MNLEFPTVGSNTSDYKRPLLSKVLFTPATSSIISFPLRYAGLTQQFRPKPVQWSGTMRKYLSIASQNLVRYSSGETTVGILPCPPKIPVDFTTISSFFVPCECANIVNNANHQLITGVIAAHKQRIVNNEMTGKKV